MCELPLHAVRTSLHASCPCLPRSLAQQQRRRARANVVATVRQVNGQRPVRDFGAKGEAR